MKLLNEYQTIIKKSKFIALSYEVSSTEEVKEILINLKKEHKRSNHIAYAYKIDNLVKKSDDKEPSNTAGTPIYKIIEHKSLNNILIVVIRYYGGIKLGSGGLIRAYGGSANEVTK